MKRLGCLVFLVVLGILAGEIYSFVVASHLLTAHAADLIGGRQWVDTVLPLVLIQGALMAVGVVAVRGAINRLPTALMGSLMGQNADAGRLMLRLVGGVLLIIPGFFLDVIGILLLLPPVQILLGRLGQKVVMAVVRQQMGRMFPGGMAGGGLPKGFPGFPGGAFPGMSPRGPLTPDERISRGPKIVDTTAERVD